MADVLEVDDARRRASRQDKRARTLHPLTAFPVATSSGQLAVADGGGGYMPVDRMPHDSSAI